MKIVIARCSQNEWELCRGEPSKLRGYFGRLIHHVVKKINGMLKVEGCNLQSHHREQPPTLVH